MRDLLQWIDKNSAPIMLGVFGGLVRQINKDKITTRVFVCGVITSAFVAVLVYLCLEDLALAPGIKSVITGISGYSAARLLELVEHEFLKKIKKIVKDTK